MTMHNARLVPQTTNLKTRNATRMPIVALQECTTTITTILAKLAIQDAPLAHTTLLRFTNPATLVCQVTLTLLNTNTAIRLALIPTSTLTSTTYNVSSALQAAAIALSVPYTGQHSARLALVGTS